MIALKINAKEYFNASVEASLFKCSCGPNKLSLTCKVSSLICPNSIENEFWWVGDKFVSDIAVYEKTKKYDGKSHYIWRQGVKHDCSKIMELRLVDGNYFNGFRRELNIEKELVYGLVKSSDLSSPVITQI